jgi:hypothetical protein
MDINGASVAIDTFLQGYTGRGGRKPTETRVHPSGDDMTAVKIWVNLGAAAEHDDLAAWCAEAETAIQKALGDQVKGITLEIRADAM